MINLRRRHEMRHDILAVYFVDREDLPRFIVVGLAERWPSVLQPYYESIEYSKDRKIFSASFSFHALYTALLLYPPFANAVLNTERYSMLQTQTVIACFPELSGRVNPLTIQMHYDYVTPPTQKEERSPGRPDTTPGSRPLTHGEDFHDK